MQYGVSASDKSAHNSTGFTKSFGYAPQIAERTEDSGRNKEIIIRSNNSVCVPTGKGESVLQANVVHFFFTNSLNINM